MKLKLLFGFAVFISALSADETVSGNGTGRKGESYGRCFARKAC